MEKYNDFLNISNENILKMNKEYEDKKQVVNILENLKNNLNDENLNNNEAPKKQFPKQNENNNKIKEDENLTDEKENENLNSFNLLLFFLALKIIYC